MKKQQFKTNVKCGACVSAISPEMEKVASGLWEVDLTHPDRILSVSSEIPENQILTALEKAGYKGEVLG